MSSVNDWAAKCAERICYEVGCVQREGDGVKPDVTSKNRITTIITSFTELLVALLREAKREHDAGWHREAIIAGQRPCLRYEDENAPCTCGADAWNARVEAVLAGDNAVYLERKRP